MVDKEIHNDLANMYRLLKAIQGAQQVLLDQVIFMLSKLSVFLSDSTSLLNQVCKKYYFRFKITSRLVGWTLCPG